MSKSLTAFLLTAYFFLIIANTSRASEFPGPTEAITNQLREIGAVIDGRRTAAIYTPLFSKDNYIGKTIHRDVAYGPHERHVLDIFTAEKSSENNKPVIVFIHGGGFSRGAKSSPDSPFYDNIMNWAVDEGMVGVNINYRLAPEFQWPSGIEDLTLLSTWLTENVSNYGGDPTQIFFWGHSAGAAHTADYLAWQANHNLEDGVAGAILTSGFYQLGGEPSIWAVYYGDDASKYSERSSLSGLLKTTTPLFANDAELDTEFAIEATKILLAAFQQANKKLTYLRLPAHSHISETYAVGTEDQSLSGPVKAFIEGIVNQ